MSTFLLAEALSLCCQIYDFVSLRRIYYVWSERVCGVSRFDDAKWNILKTREDFSFIIIFFSEKSRRVVASLKLSGTFRVTYRADQIQSNRICLCFQHQIRLQTITNLLRLATYEMLRSSKSIKTGYFDFLECVGGWVLILLLHVITRLDLSISLFTADRIELVDFARTQKSHTFSIRNWREQNVRGRVAKKQTSVESWISNGRWIWII